MGALDPPLSEKVQRIGQVVGESVDASGNTHDFLCEDGVMIDLGTLGGRYSVATGIDESGQVIGTRLTASGDSHAVMWER